MTTETTAGRARPPAHRRPALAPPGPIPSPTTNDRTYARLVLAVCVDDELRYAATVASLHGRSLLVGRADAARALAVFQLWAPGRLVYPFPHTEPAPSTKGGDR
jgi:hypothetical protein